MRIVYPRLDAQGVPTERPTQGRPQALPRYSDGANSTIQFGRIPVEAFLQDGAWNGAIEGMNIFYVLEFVGKQRETGSSRVFKIGISRGGEPARRLKAYYNMFGPQSAERRCEGVFVRFIAGTNARSSQGALPSRLQVAKLELAIKTGVADSNILRADEWLEITEPALRRKITNFLRTLPVTNEEEALPPRDGLRSAGAVRRSGRSA